MHEGTTFDCDQCEKKFRKKTQCTGGCKNPCNSSETNAVFTAVHIVLMRNLYYINTCSNDMALVARHDVPTFKKVSFRDKTLINVKGFMISYCLYNEL